VRGQRAPGLTGKRARSPDAPALCRVRLTKVSKDTSPAPAGKLTHTVVEPVAPRPVTDALLHFAGLGAVIIVEFRGQAADEIKWIDKEDGKTPRRIGTYKVAVELLGSSRQVLVELMPPRGQEEVDALPYKKGQTVLMVLRTWTVGQKGITATLESHCPVTV